MNKFMTIIGLAVIIISTINLTHYSGNPNIQILCLLIGCGNFISGFLEELNRIFNK